MARLRFSATLRHQNPLPRTGTDSISSSILNIVSPILFNFQNDFIRQAGSKSCISPARNHRCSSASQFDFSLVKLEAPPEYAGLETSLSTLRRQEAQEGALHVTAWKLCALFRALAPAAPALIKAYGQRVSEISADPAINPKGTSKHGIFQIRVGADGTSIWAAATSDALAVNLLSYMLARIWTGPEATSVWVELVQARKQEIIQSRTRRECRFRDRGCGTTRHHTTTISGTGWECGRLGLLVNRHVCQVVIQMIISLFPIKMIIMSWPCFEVHVIGCGCLRTLS